VTARLIAVGIGVLGLVVAFAWQRWPLRDVGRDVGPSVLVEDRRDDPGPCPGPLVWFDVDGGHALLECHTCGYVLSTGNFSDERHSSTPLMREGMAS
jgi:hypothetical protein